MIDENHPRLSLVRRLMRAMGLRSLAPRPNTSRRAPGHRVYPYLLRDLAVGRPNQVWCADLTYLPMARGFLYLVAIMDWYSRKVLSWGLSTTQDTVFCVHALLEAVERNGTPEVFNTDQGSQFTSTSWTGELIEHGIRISMDGKGRWIDNVFIERLWRSPASNAWTWRRKTSMSGSPDIGRVAGRSARSVRVHTFAPLAHELHSINNTISIKKEKTKTVQSGSI